MSLCHGRGVADCFLSPPCTASRRVPLPAEGPSPLCLTPGQGSDAHYCAADAGLRGLRLPLPRSRWGRCPAGKALSHKRKHAPTRTSHATWRHDTAPLKRGGRDEGRQPTHLEARRAAFVISSSEAMPAPFTGARTHTHAYIRGHAYTRHIGGSSSARRVPRALAPSQQRRTVHDHGQHPRVVPAKAEVRSGPRVLSGPGQGVSRIGRGGYPAACRVCGCGCVLSLSLSLSRTSSSTAVGSTSTLPSWVTAQVAPPQNVFMGNPASSAAAHAAVRHAVGSCMRGSRGGGSGGQGSPPFAPCGGAGHAPLRRR